MSRRALSPRGAALQAIDGVRFQGASLSTLLPSLEPRVGASQRGVFKALAFGTLRWLPRLQAALRCLLDKPLPQKERALESLLLTGLYQLSHMDTPSHRVVNDCIDALRHLGKPWAKGLVNGVLRNYLRERDEIEAQLHAQAPAVQTAHPRWLVRQLQEDWPEDWQAVLEANNQRAPMSLRVNLQRQTREAYLQALQNAELPARAALETASGIVLGAPCGVDKLPGFAEGRVSVQDLAAQQAAPLLPLQAGQRVLDACAAPGGKTAHILERLPGQIALWALDAVEERLARVAQTLARLQLKAELRCADATDLDAWWDGQKFDAILLDAPCTGTGVIRRHPDIKWLRKAEDVANTAALQATLLQRLWRTLKPGGHLLYATCSVVQAENAQQVAQFLAQTPDAEARPLAFAHGRASGAGWQFLPGEGQMDGFFYALMRKQRT